jgi:hypothetical protein
MFKPALQNQHQRDPQHRPGCKPMTLHTEPINSKSEIKCQSIINFNLIPTQRIRKITERLLEQILKTKKKEA